MIEVKNLTKTYKTKTKVRVKALDGVSIKFASKGMVFILGKSGSGKSTLLNVMGGLDGYDSGEILIKGEGTDNFKQSHYDSYRNTYIGFIFQEYNIIEDFTVGANIALAIELQGRKAENDEINEILREVELDGLGARRPNELSGGQKQRVAIARALVKRPEIIMADEPTGALDSSTGKQVFDTLKKLSKDKLVIVVSHDREFAEQYGDRIVELKDGKIISDVTKTDEDVEEENLVYENNSITVKQGYVLTSEDLKNINEYLAKMKGDTEIKTNFKKAKSSSFTKTDQDKIETSKEGFKLIKSHLPLKAAFKLGSSGLKHKKFRLVFTIILSFIAFTLFGLSDTIASYNKITTGARSIIDSGVDYAAFNKSKKYFYDDGDVFWDDNGYYISEDDIKEISANTGVKLKGVITERSFYKLEYNVDYGEERKSSLYPNYFSGYSSLTASELDDFGYSLVAGTLPINDKEVAISAYVARLFMKYKYKDGLENKTDIKSYNDLVGKALSFNTGDLKIVGVIDTKFDENKYSMLDKDFDTLSPSDMIVYFALSEELEYCIDYSLNAVLFVSKDYLNLLLESERYNYKNSYNFGEFSYAKSVDEYYTYYWGQITTHKNVRNARYVDGENLTDDDIICTWQQLLDYSYYLSNDKYNQTLQFNDNDLSSEILKYRHELLISADTFRELYLNDYNLKRFVRAIHYAKENEISSVNERIEEINEYLSSSDYENQEEEAVIFEEALNKYNLKGAFYDISDFDKYLHTFTDGGSEIKGNKTVESFVLNGQVEFYAGKYVSLEETLYLCEYLAYSNVATDFFKQVKEGSIICSDEMYEEIYSHKNDDYQTKVNAMTTYVSNYEYSLDYGEFARYYLTEKLNICTSEIISKAIKDKDLKIFIKFVSSIGTESFEKEFNVKGVFGKTEMTIAFSDNVYEGICGFKDDGLYTTVVGPMPTNVNDVKRILKFSYDESKDYKYDLLNGVTYELELLQDILDVLGKVFLYIGIGFALFASLMLSNFIGTSVAYKKQDIGILRAIGSRSSDVFKIFFAESFIIACINFLLSTIGTIGFTALINSTIRKDVGLQVTVLAFGIRQVLVLFAISVIVAVIATYLPVRKIASKKPIDAIRNK